MTARWHTHRRVKWPTSTFLKKKAWRLVSHPIFLVLTLFGNLLIVLGASGLYIAEGGINPNINTMLDTIWWAVGTVTTVGYGDIIPVTTAGRVIGILLMILGTAAFWSYTALFADALMSEEFNDFENELKSIESKLKFLRSEEDYRSEETHEVLANIERHLNDLKVLTISTRTNGRT